MVQVKPLIKGGQDLGKYNTHEEWKQDHPYQATKRIHFSRMKTEEKKIYFPGTRKNKQMVAKSSHNTVPSNSKKNPPPVWNDRFDRKESEEEVRIRSRKNADKSENKNDNDTDLSFASKLENKRMLNALSANMNEKGRIVEKTEEKVSERMILIEKLRQKEKERRLERLDITLPKKIDVPKKSLEPSIPFQAGGKIHSDHKLDLRTVSRSISPMEIDSFKPQRYGLSNSAVLKGIYICTYVYIYMYIYIYIYAYIGM
jgi:hypothetical protein